MPLLKFPQAARVAHRHRNNVNPRPQVYAQCTFSKLSLSAGLSHICDSEGRFFAPDVGTSRTELPKRRNTQIRSQVLAFGTYVDMLCYQQAALAQAFRLVNAAQTPHSVYVLQTARLTLD